MPTDPMRRPDTTATVPRLGLTRVEAAEAIGVSVRLLDQLLADPQSGFPAARVRGRVVIPVAQLRDWLAAQTEETIR